MLIILTKTKTLTVTTKLATKSKLLSLKAMRIRSLCLSPFPRNRNPKFPLSETLRVLKRVSG